MNKITVWERKIKQKDGSWKWEHNHISTGYDPNQKSPSPAVDRNGNLYLDQVKSWSNGIWRSTKAYLVNGVVKYEED